MNRNADALSRLPFTENSVLDETEWIDSAINLVRDFNERKFDSEELQKNDSEIQRICENLDNFPGDYIVKMIFCIRLVMVKN